MKTFFVILGLSISTMVVSQTPEERLTQLGLTLPTVPTPAANYVNAVRTGNLLFLAGKGPTKPDGKFVTGKSEKTLVLNKDMKQPV